jgi:hypothetical protein
MMNRGSADRGMRSDEPEGLGDVATKNAKRHEEKELYSTEFSVAPCLCGKNLLARKEERARNGHGNIKKVWALPPWVGLSFRKVL